MKALDEILPLALAKSIVHSVLVNPDNNLFDISKLEPYSVKKGSVSGMPHATRVGVKGDKNDRPLIYIASTTLSNEGGVINAKVVVLLDPTSGNKLVYNVSDSNVESSDVTTVTKYSGFMYHPDETKKYIQTTDIAAMSYVHSILVCTQWLEAAKHVDAITTNVKDVWFGEPAHMSLDSR